MTWPRSDSWKVWEQGFELELGEPKSFHTWPLPKGSPDQHCHIQGVCLAGAGAIYPGRRRLRGDLSLHCVIYVEGSRINTVGRILSFLKVHLKWVLVITGRRWSSHWLLEISLSVRPLDKVFSVLSICECCINGVSSHYI